MPSTPEAIVVGAGHNGLACACYLARAGMKVLVLEQYHAVGGMTLTEEVTRPGFWSDLHASGYQLANLSPAPAELEAAEGFGLHRIVGFGDYGAGWGWRRQGERLRDDCLPHLLELAGGQPHPTHA